jgi:hypothetical protein
MDISPTKPCNVSSADVLNRTSVENAPTNAHIPLSVAPAKKAVQHSFYDVQLQL